MIHVKKYGSKSAIKISNPAEAVDVFISYQEPMLLVDYNEKKIQINTTKWGNTTSHHLNMFKDDADVEGKKEMGWEVQEVEAIGPVYGTDYYIKRETQR